MKISYCITCKGRLSHLQQTLPANVAAFAGEPDVEFVVLDYDCPERTAEWVRTQFPAEVESGRIRLARHEPAPRFRVEHAKNMAARLATGEVVCCVDADNFLADGLTAWLRRVFTADPNAFVMSRPVTFLASLAQKLRARMSGTPLPIREMTGLIAMSRANFLQIGGYNEAFVGGFEDIDLGVGASRLGLTAMMWPPELWSRVITHEDDLRLQFAPDRTREITLKRQKQSRVTHVLRGVSVLFGRRGVRVNLDGQVGCGQVALGMNAVPFRIERLPAATGKRPRLNLAGRRVSLLAT